MSEQTPYSVIFQQDTPGPWGISETNLYYFTQEDAVRVADCLNEAYAFGLRIRAQGIGASSPEPSSARTTADSPTAIAGAPQPHEEPSPTSPVPDPLSEEQIERLAMDFCAKPTGEDGQPGWDLKEVTLCANFLRFTRARSLSVLSEGMVDAVMKIVRKEVNDYCSACISMGTQPINRTAVLFQIENRINNLTKT